MVDKRKIGREALDDAANLIVAAIVGAGSGQIYVESGAAGLTGFIVPMLFVTFAMLFMIKLIIT